MPNMKCQLCYKLYFACFIFIASLPGPSLAAASSTDKINAFNCFVENEIAYIIVLIKTDGFKKTDAIKVAYPLYYDLFDTMVQKIINDVYKNKNIKSNSSQHTIKTSLDKIFNACIEKNNLGAYQAKMYYCRTVTDFSKKIFELKENGLSLASTKKRFSTLLSRHGIPIRLIDNIYASSSPEKNYIRAIWTVCSHTLDKMIQQQASINENLDISRSTRVRRPNLGNTGF